MIGSSVRAREDETDIYGAAHELETIKRKPNEITTWNCEYWWWFGVFSRETGAIYSGGKAGQGRALQFTWQEFSRESSQKLACLLGRLHGLEAAQHRFSCDEEW